MELDFIADELYGLPLEDFTETRKEREKQARDAGDNRLAAEIHALSKPNWVAWLVNQLVRDSPDELRALLELGSSLREATATLSGDVLRELSQQQRQVIGALVGRAERRAEAAGRSVSGDAARSLEETLHSALADPEAAELLTGGRLTTGLHATGFAGPEQASGDRTLPARGSSGAGRRSTGKRGAAGGGQQAHDLRITRAAKAVSDAEEAVGQAQSDLHQAEELAAESRDRIERLRQELKEAMQAQSMASREQRRAQQALDRADRSEQDARRRLTELSQP